MITVKLNLRQLKHALMTTKKGAKAIVIPLIENNLFEGEKGIYLDIVGFDYEDKTGKQYPDTHLLKQSFSKDELSKMDEYTKKNIPILGNARVSGFSSHDESLPNGSDEVVQEVDDLPF